MNEQKPEQTGVSESGIRAHLNGKVEEWLDSIRGTGVRFGDHQDAEQVFKDWLWGASHGR